MAAALVIAAIMAIVIVPKLLAQLGVSAAGAGLRRLTSGAVESVRSQGRIRTSLSFDEAREALRALESYLPGASVDLMPTEVSVHTKTGHTDIGVEVRGIENTQVWIKFNQMNDTARMSSAILASLRKADPTAHLL